MSPRWAAFLLILGAAAHAKPALDYRLRYALSFPDVVAITLRLPEPLPGPVPLVAARTYPGGYAQVPYDAFVSMVIARSADGKSLRVVKDADAPRWMLGQAGEKISRIEYVVNVSQMEKDIHDAVSTSKVRRGYVGLLGYSVFPYVEGLEDRKIRLQVDAPEGWPVLTTVRPVIPPSTAKTSAAAKDYYELADSEILMGPDLHVTKIDGVIPLVMAIYAEGDVDPPLEGRLAREALDRVQYYFGDIPFPQYTVQLEILRPLAGHTYGFSQEHIDSGTFNRAVEEPITAHSSVQDEDRRRFNYAHHMAHCWIPKRAYGVGYQPFTWEMTPVIDTIWFNEGFGRYAAIEAIVAGMPPAQGSAFRDSQLDALRAVIASAEPFIRRMPLSVLSREASFLYATDFRTGRNVFARGALMAADMDDRIRTQSDGRRSLQDALRWLLRWSAENRKAFQAEDLPGYFAMATGVNVSDIFETWQRPLVK